MHWHREHKRCEFHSIATDSVDMLVFTLLGGYVPDLARRIATAQQNAQRSACTRWDWRSCPCRAPRRLQNFSRVYVEVGANNGLHMSNSYFFDHTLRWRGLCIEADPELFKQLQHNRPNCTNVHALIGPSRQDVPYISFSRPARTPEHLKMWQTGLSGIEGAGGQGEVRESLAKARRFAQEQGLEAARNLLPMRPFAQVFREHGIRYIDFLSIDVEGAELELLQTIDFAEVHVRIIAIEINAPPNQMRNRSSQASETVDFTRGQKSLGNIRAAVLRYSSHVGAGDSFVLVLHVLNPYGSGELAASVGWLRRPRNADDER